MQTQEASSLTFRELAVLYQEHARTYYRRRDGSHTGEHRNVASWLKHIEHFNDVHVERLTRHAVRAWLDQLVAHDLSRSYINTCLSRLRRMLRWAADLDYIGDAPLLELQRVRPLAAHRSAARETEPRTAVAPCVLTATIPHLSPVPRAVIQILQLTGSRVGEILNLRNRDIDMRDASTWWAVPNSHKNTHRNQARAIPLDTRCIAIVQRHMRPFCPDDPLFPSPRDRSKAFSRDGLYTAIQRAAKKAGVQRWSSHQIRHLVASQVREHASLDHAQVLLGHASIDTTQIYTHMDRRLAQEAQQVLYREVPA